MTRSGSGGYLVGGRVVRPVLGEVGSGEQRAHLEPRSMQVLEALCERPGEVCSKAELIDAVWGEAYVSDEVLTHAIWDIRRAFGDKPASPEFIQTIPKKGYRLIATVEPLARDGESAARAAPLGWSAAGWAAAVIGLLLVASLLVRRETRTESASPLRDELATLVLLPTAARGGSELLGRQLSGQLADRLPSEAARLDEGFALHEAEACEARGLSDTYCLETSVSPSREGLEVTARLVAAPSRIVAWALPPIAVAGPDALASAAAEVAAAVAAYFEVLGSPDFKPWISFDKHHIEAIQSFLVAARYVFRNEVGGGDLMRVALEIDPEFIAPRVWRTPAVAGSADPSAIAEQRRALESLSGTGSHFENVMLQWAIALLDGRAAEQVRHLRVALELEPANRPTRLVLAGTLMGQGSLERAWSHFAALVEEGWKFPGLYPAAGKCALLLGRIDDAEVALEKAQGGDRVDPESLALLELLAIYEEDAARQAELAADLELRAQEMLPEVFEPDMAPFARVLADAAEAEGRLAIAAKLRESVD